MPETPLEKRISALEERLVIWKTAAIVFGLVLPAAILIAFRVTWNEIPEKTRKALENAGVTDAVRNLENAQSEAEEALNQIKKLRDEAKSDSPMLALGWPDNIANPNKRNWPYIKLEDPDTNQMTYFIFGHTGNILFYKGSTKVGEVKLTDAK